MITAFFTPPGDQELVNLICRFFSSDDDYVTYDINSEEIHLRETDIAVFFGEGVARRVRIKSTDQLILPTLSEFTQDPYPTYLKLLQFRPSEKFRLGVEILAKSGSYTIGISVDGKLTSSQADVKLTEREVQVIRDISKLIGCQEVEVVVPANCGR